MMNRLKETWYVGQTVWGRYRKTWYPASITGLGYKFIGLLFTDKAVSGYITRIPEDVRSRDPQLKGEDEPQEED